MATYSGICSAVGEFGYANRFALYVVLTNRDGNPATNQSIVDYSVYLENTSEGGTFTSNTRLYFAMNGIIVRDETLSITGPRNGRVSIASGSMTVTHKDDGAKVIGFQALVQSKNYGVSCNVQKDFTLTTIPRASTITCSTAYIGSNPTISIKRASDSFTHTVTYTFGSGNTLKTGTIATKTTSISITNWSIPESFYECIPNNTEGTGSITCITYNGNTVVGSKTCSFTAKTVENICKPTVNATLTDINPTTANLVAGMSTVANKLVANKSTARLVINTTLNKSAGSIKSVTVNGTNIGANTSITKDYINVNVTKFEIIVTDTRNYSTTYTFSKDNGNLTIINYVPLTLNSNFFRPQPTTGEVQLTYSGNYFNGDFGSVSNTLSITWKYRAQGTNSWITGGTLTPTLSGNKISKKTISLGTSFNYQTAYDFQLTAVDKLTTITRNVTVSVGMPIFYWGEDFLTVTGTLNSKALNVNGENITNRIEGYGQTCKLVTGDWNTACGTTSGFYRGVNLSNCPAQLSSNNWFFVINLAHSSSYVAQIAIAYFQLKVYARISNNGTWSDWKQFTLS